MYKYEQQRAIDSKRKVHTAIQESSMPWMRICMLDQQLDLSIGSIHNHLQKLQEERKVIRVGVRYVSVQDLQDMKIWQLKRIARQADEEVKKATRLEERIQDKVELKKEQLREFRGNMSEWKFRNMEQEIMELMEHQEYLEEKKKWNRKAVEVIFRVIELRCGVKTEKSGDDVPHFQDSSTPIPA